MLSETLGQFQIVDVVGGYVDRNFERAAAGLPERRLSGRRADDPVRQAVD